MIELTGRLKAISDKIPLCSTLVDVGTDHAYIPIYAVAHRICGFAVASDLRKGPVETALRNVLSHGMGDKIAVRLGYGLANIEIQECRIIVIAGMGGMQISEILEESLEKAKSAELIILQPMSDIESSRKWLFDNGFGTLEETLAKEDDKIYNIICCRWNGRSYKYDDFSCYIGDMLIKSGHPLLLQYLEKKLKHVEKIVIGRQNAKTAIESNLDWVYIRDRLIEEIIALKNGEEVNEHQM